MSRFTTVITTFLTANIVPLIVIGVVAIVVPLAIVRFRDPIRSVKQKLTLKLKQRPSMYQGIGIGVATFVVGLSLWIAYLYLFPVKCMPPDLPGGDWPTKVNAAYQDVMKTFMNLVTASLVLPLFLVRNFRVTEGKTPPGDYLSGPALWSWAMMLLSLGFCWSFFWASAKYIKVVTGGAESESLCWCTFERARDLSVWGSALAFFVGLVCVLRFFHQLHKRFSPPVTDARDV